MIAVDTNILVYAHRRDADWHTAARRVIQSLAEGHATWGIPWPCIHEFVAITTHPRVFDPPSTIEQAAAQVEAWMASPRLVLLGEDDAHWQRLKSNMFNGRISGPKVHDARIASICEGHGVTSFLTADRDFTRFPRLFVRNPLVQA